jgi:hypothetical protein
MTTGRAGVRRFARIRAGHRQDDVVRPFSHILLRNVPFTQRVGGAFFSVIPGGV